MKRREFLKRVGASGGVAALPLARAASADRTPPNNSERPNVLIMMADQHSPHVLGCCGDPVVKTPNLDALAGRGVLFRSTYCAAPLCVPSRMAFLTGQQPSSTQVWANSDILASDIPTFAHALGAAGYDATLIGRMHFSGIDQWHGFGRRLVGDVLPPYPYLKIPLTPELLVGAEGIPKSVQVAGPGKTAYQAYDEDVTESAIRFLREKARGSAQPFCAVVGFVLPHPPFVCSKADWDYYYDRVKLPQIPPGYFEGLNPAIRLWRKAHGVDNLTEEEVRRARTGYYGLVTQLDRQVGRILSAFDELTIARDTVVIYTSDHGESAGENGMWWKMNFYEGAVTVPLIISWPGVWQRARRSEVTRLTDVAPTLLELANAGTLPQAAGNSLIPLLEGRSGNWINEAFSEYPPADGIPAMRMVRSGQWKLVYFDGVRPQLFNLENDRHEFQDLATESAYSEIRSTLDNRALAGWSAEYIKSELRKHAVYRAILTKWAYAVRPPANPVWISPPGVNQFP